MARKDPLPVFCFKVQLSINNGHGDWAISWNAWQAGSALHG